MLSMDTQLLVRAAKGAGSRASARLLVLLSAVTDGDVATTLKMTVRSALLRVRRGSGTPMGESLRKLITFVKVERGLSLDDCLFASQKRVGTLKPIGRVQAWRVIHKALASIGLAGAWSVLRQTFQELRLPPEEALIDLEGLVPAPLTVRASIGRGPPRI